MDEEKAKHKSRKQCDQQIGFLGLQCRHCGGESRGSYFPSSAKTLQATPLSLHSHLIICEHVPADIKRALKLTKSRHKFSAMVKPAGSQASFFNALWNRIQSPTFTGADKAEMDTIQLEIDFIIEQSKPKPKMQQLPVAISRQHETMTTVNQAHVELPNVVSYDLENEYNLAYASQALDDDVEVEVVELNTTTSSPTEEDLETALELLRQPETPGDHPSEYLLQSPDMAFAMTPAAVSGLLAPIPTRMSSSGERYHDGRFVISSNYDVNNFPDDGHGHEEEEKEEEKEEKKSPRPSDDGKTRKFTRSDEVHLVRGILKYGKSSWKKIWQETSGLHHIKHSALKDRARSKRFQSILERAQKDPSLLDRPHELCGDENSPAYHSPMMAGATPRTESSTPPIGIRGVEPFAAYCSLQRR